MQKKPSLIPTLVGPNGAAQIAGVSRSRIYELLNSGEIPSRKDGRRRLIHRDDIEKWFSGLPPAPASKRAPSEPPSGPLLPPDERRLAIERAIEPEPDWAALYRERLRLLRRDIPQAEAEARALEYVIRLCREHHGCDLEAAKAAVLTAIAPPREPAHAEPQPPDHRSTGRGSSATDERN
jgi:excisionase family DNA binding protein